MLFALAGRSLARVCRASDRDALLALKAQLIDADGVLEDWDASTNCCDWTVRLRLLLWISKLMNWILFISRASSHFVSFSHWAICPVPVIHYSDSCCLHPGRIVLLSSPRKREFVLLNLQVERT
jgi:hypothetical protein